MGDHLMVLQGKAVGVQQQEVAVATAAAGEAQQQWLTRLRGMEQLLFSAQRAQFLDIRKREAEAFKVLAVDLILLLTVD